MTPQIKVNTTNNMPAVQRAVQKAAFRNFKHAAASISKDVKSTLVTAEGPSSAGSPPHTHKGAFLRRAIRYQADGDGAIIGPLASLVGQAGAAHEKGETFYGIDYPERPFMGPALERAIPRFAGDWQSSVHE